MSQPKIICRIHEVDKPFIYYFSHDDNFTSAAADEFNRNEQTGQHKHKVGPYVEHSAYDSLRESLKLAVEALEHLADSNYAITDNGVGYTTKNVCVELYTDKQIDIWAKEILDTIKAKGEL